MNKTINESQEDFNFKLGPDKTTKTGKKLKKLYMFGNTYELNMHLKNSGDSIKKYLGKWGGLEKTTNGWAPYVTIWQDKETGEFDVENGKKLFKGYIDKINEFYKYTLKIDELLNNLKDYKPSGLPEEEANEITRRVENFKEKILNITSSEELQNMMKLMMDVKAAKGSKYDFTPFNKMAIKMQRPDATIVANKHNWKEFYNRTIREEAKPIYIKAPSKKGFDANIEKNYLAKLGKKKSELTGTEKAELYNLQGKRQKGNAVPNFHWTDVYDVKDTVQIEGTHDELASAEEKAKAAAEKLAGRTLGDIDTDTQTTTNEKIIKPVYNGLVAYADAQNIKGNINVSKEVNANYTKLLASALLSQILSGKLKGVASRAAVEAKTPAARKQQAEVASWQFMDAFGVQYNLADVDMNIIFGANIGDDNDKAKRAQKNRMNNVLKDIASAVNHLIDYVNIHIKDNANLSEIEGNMPQGKHVTVNDIAKDLGIPSDMINEFNIEELHERLRKKLNLL